MTETELQL